MIRPLYSNEVEVMLEAGNSFYLEAKLPGVFSNEVFVRRMRQLIDSGEGIIFASFNEQNEFRGALAAAVCECLFTGARMAVEVFWYILPRFRGGTSGMKLIQTYDRWCKFNGIDVGAMIRLELPLGGLEPGQLDEIYNRMGHHCVERHFIKDYRV